jgi:L-threonylcarbamoyladenylate synthase
MGAELIDLNGVSDEAAVEAAVTALERGDLVVIPTETVYGLVADPRVPDSIERIYEAKQRDRGKPLQMLVTGVDQIQAMGFELNEVECRLAEACWPGGLTLIVSSEGRSEGFRVPDSPIALEIAARVGGALWATSANSSGEPAALTADDAVACLGDAVAVVLNGGRVERGVASTVARVDSAGEVEVLREGAISSESLKAIGEMNV